MKGSYVALALVALVGLAGVGAWKSGIMAGGNSAAAAAGGAKEVRWLLAHQPNALYERGAKEFDRVLRERTGGSLTLKVLSPKDVGYAGAGDIPYSESLKYLADGKADLTSLYTVAASAADASLGVLQLPYLFDSYASAQKVFDGAPGKAILDAMSEKTPLTMLAFTYSGGYRIIVSKNKKIERLSDLKGLRVATSGGAQAEALLRAAGAVPVPMDLETTPAELKDIDAVETTYSRLSSVVNKQASFAKYLNETNHSLFTTAIAADDAFFSSLTPVEQDAVRAAASAAAALEREDSIAAGEKGREDFIAAGSTVVVPANLIAALKEKAQEVVSAYIATYGSDLVNAIRAAQ